VCVCSVVTPHTSFQATRHACMHAYIHTCIQYIHTYGIHIDIHANKCHTHKTKTNEYTHTHTHNISPAAQSWRHQTGQQYHPGPHIPQTLFRGGKIIGKVKDTHINGRDTLCVCVCARARSCVRTCMRACVSPRWADKVGVDVPHRMSSL